MSYIESILLGVSLAALPGPIFFEVLRRTLTKGFWSGAMLAVGEFLANFTVLMLTFFGAYHVLLSTPLKIALFAVGGGVLLWLGWTALNMKKADIENSGGRKQQRNNSIFVGFAMGVSSPLAIAVWISVGGAYLAQYTSPETAFINIVLLAWGVMLFFVAMAMLVHFTRHTISARYILAFARLSGIILAAYGLYFLYQLFTLLRF